MSDSNILVYLMRRDLRVSDNPVFHALSTKKDHGFTHLLPLYVFSAEQLEVSGFIKDPGTKSPYPEARSRIANFWRCGPHRAKFLGESVWDLKNGLEKVGSGLCIRVGTMDDTIKTLLDGLQKKGGRVGAVWMTSEYGTEEQREENSVRNHCAQLDVAFKTWVDEKYLKDDRDLPFSDPKDLPNVFTTYRNKVEPLRKAPRPVLSISSKGSLPPFPQESMIPAQESPFQIPKSHDDLQEALYKPLNKAPLIRDPPTFPEGARSAHPLMGGESQAQKRLEHQISTGAMTTYKSTRNGLLGDNFSTKLSAYLSLGCITARQIHETLLSFEDGTDEKWAGVQGHGKGENEGTKAVRFELLWRDYMRLCTRKFGPKLFRLSGFAEDKSERWFGPDHPPHEKSGQEIQRQVERLMNGTTGMGFIDASQRELYHTGYTSNRARQNFASFLAKHLKLDWRIGAEWYESMLIDYDLSSNWGNWQYLAGVGNDPRGEARIFNPVKQAFDYDPKAEYVKAWVPELRGLSDRGEIFQAWTMKDQRKRELELGGVEWIEHPLKKINFTEKKPSSRPHKQRGGGGPGSKRK